MTMSGRSIQQDRFDKLGLILTAFERSGIDYVLVGESPEALRHEIAGDVDIVVSKEGGRCLMSVFRRIQIEHGIQLLHVYRHEPGVFGSFVVWESDGGWRYLGPDICSDYFRHGHRLLSCQTMLEGRVRDPSTGFWFPRPEADFCYYLLKKIGKGFIDDNQLSFLQAKLKLSDRNKIAAILDSVMGAKSVASCFDRVERGEIAEFVGSMPGLRRNIRWRTISIPASFLRNAVRSLRHLFFPNGAAFLLGVDNPKDAASICEAWQKMVAPFFRHSKVVVCNSERLGARLRFETAVAKWSSTGILVLCFGNTQCFGLNASFPFDDCCFQSLGPSFSGWSEFLVRWVVSVLGGRVSRRMGSC